MSILSAMICCGRPSIKDGKSAIALLQVIFVAVLIILRIVHFTDKPLAFLLDIDLFKNSILLCRKGNEVPTQDDPDCLKVQLTYRWAWSVACLFVTLLLLTMCGLGRHALTSCFLLKLITPVAFFFAFIFIPDVFFDYILYIGGFIAAAAYIFVFIFVLSFAQKWNNTWTQNMTDNRRDGKSGALWQIWILFFCAVFFAASIAGLVLIILDEQDWNALAEGNNLLYSRTALVIGTFAIMCLATLFSLFSCVKHGNLLTSCVMMAFLITLCWGATLNKYDVSGKLQNEDSATLEDVSEDRSTGNLVSLAIYLCIMAAWAFVALVMSTRERVSTKDPHQDAISIGLDRLELKRDSTTSEPEAEKTKVKCGWSMLFFLLHVSIPLALMSLVSQKPKSPVEHEEVEFWLYAVVIMICLVIYMLHLAVPLCCRRDAE